MATSTLKDLIPGAAGHELLGSREAFVSSSATAASADAISLVDSALIDRANVTPWTDWWLYIHADAGGQSGLAGSSRRVDVFDPATGKITWVNGLARNIVVGDKYWLLRSFHRDEWRDFANRALNEMKRRVVVTQVGVGSNDKRYAPPASILRLEDVVDIGVRASPETEADGKPRPLAWWGWEDNDGVLTLLLNRDIATTEELVYTVNRPYLAPDAAGIAADSDTTTAYRDWLIAEMVAKALTTAWARAQAGADRQKLIDQLKAAGTLVAGFRAYYMPAPIARPPLQLDPYF